MSVTIDYFFNYDKPLSELVVDVNRVLGCNLSPYQDASDDLFARFLGMEFSLSSAEGLVDDRELDLTNFRYTLDFKTPWGDAASRPVQVPAMLCVIYELHKWLGITGILVYDVQILLARYEEREIDGYGKRLYDLVSESPFVSFAGHLNCIIERLPDSWKDFYA